MAARPVLPFTFLAPCVQETFRTFFFPVPRFLSMSLGQRHLDSARSSGSTRCRP